MTGGGTSAHGPGAELAALGPGTFVTVRHRVPDLAISTAADSGNDPGGDRPLLADVVATVVRITDDRADLRRGDGTAVSVRLDRVTAVRVLPRAPGPGRPLDVLGLTRIAAAGWPAAETRWLGNWLLRAAGGWTRRANSALVLGPPDRPTAAALAACRDWYTARGLAPLLSVPAIALEPGSPALLSSAELESAGWQLEAPTAVLVARSADVLAAVEIPVRGQPAVRLAPSPSASWLADYRDAATNPAARDVLAGPAAPARVRFVGVSPAPELSAAAGRQDETQLAARGRAVTVDGWVGLSAVGVDPGHRRRGLGRLVTATLLADGLRHGGVRTYLEVEVANAAGTAFWHRLGYREAHRSVYFRLSGSDGPAGR